MAAASLHVLAPGLTASMPGVDRLSPPLSQPMLERFLSRSHQETVPGYDPESTLCHLFGIEPGENGDYPIAALRRAATGMGDERFWLQAEPVCLRPDQTRLLLFDTRDFEVSAAELKSLQALFVSHFEPEGWIVETDDPFCWYLSPAAPSAISSHTLGDVFGRNMDLFLPRGRDRLRWHRLLNEVQMLFFGSEVNQLREAAGKMPIGGLWFSGFGHLPERITSRYRCIFADDALSAGLARLSATPLSGLQSCRGKLLRESGVSLALYPHLQRPVWRADTFDWAEKIGDFAAWMEQRLSDLLRTGRDELLLYPCDGRIFRFNRRCGYRFWRSSRPMAAWLKPTN
ncbi:MAG: hypothetical protein KDI74_10995 [Gammaproteobacteria bacterium]|nr:hypothetical protein [Gammaproteobacteria bacterium]